jgi:hypothetical protein
MTPRTIGIPSAPSFKLTLPDCQALPSGAGPRVFDAPDYNAHAGFYPSALSRFSAVTNGVSVASVLIPAGPAFQGLNFFAQSMSATPAASQLGVLASNALDIVVQNQ